MLEGEGISGKPRAERSGKDIFKNLQDGFYFTNFHSHGFSWERN